MRVNEVIRKRYPEASEEFCEFILWARTPFPMGQITARSLYKATDRYLRAINNKLRLCEWCDNLSEIDSFTCKSCSEALNKARVAQS